MNIAKHLAEMKSIQEDFLEFLEDDKSIDKNFENLKIKFEEMKIQDNKHNLRLLLHLISSICNNFYRSPNFFQQN